MENSSKYRLYFALILKDLMHLECQVHIAVDAKFSAEEGIHGVHLAREESLKVCRATCTTQGASAKPIIS